MNVYDALGLTDGEKRVYESLVKLKSSTTGPLYKKSMVSQSKVYEILNRLKQKGLASSIVKKNKTYWHPANPSLYFEKIKSDLENLKERKQVLEEKLPLILKEESYTSDEARVLIGYNGFRACLYSFLDSFESGEGFVVFGSPIEIPEPFYSFLKSYNIERVKRNIYAKFLYGEELKSFAKGMYSLPKTELKFIKGLTPSTIAIGKDRVIIMVWREGGKFVVINGREIAESYRIFFNSLWKMAAK